MPGDIAEVPDLQANILIKLNFAEAFGESDPIEYLKNLNGTVVVDDFGSLVLVQKADSSVDVGVKEKNQGIEPSKPKTARARKTK